jgi:CCR4-NOT complex subunit CAF16
MGHRDSFRDTTLNLHRTMVAADWGTRSIAYTSHAAAYCADIAVEEMMVELQKTYPERRETLMKTLRIEPTWRMHKVHKVKRHDIASQKHIPRPTQRQQLQQQQQQRASQYSSY